MRVDRTRALLMGVWFASFAIGMIIVIALRATGDLHEEFFWASLRALSSAYAPYLVAVGLFYWSSPLAGAIHRERSSRLMLAIGSSLVWNGAILAALLPLVFRRSDIDSALQTISVVASTLSWLVAGTIGYYFVPVKDR